MLDIIYVLNNDNNDDRINSSISSCLAVPSRMLLSQIVQRITG